MDVVCNMTAMLSKPYCVNGRELDVLCLLPLGPQMSLPLSPPSSPDPLQDTGSRWSKMGRPLEPKPMPTQHNKHLLDNAISRWAEQYAPEGHCHVAYIDDSII